MVTPVAVVREKAAPWAGYGRLLAQGMSAHLPRRENLIQLERTGPFIPAITFPGAGDVVVTNKLRGLLEREQLSGVTFRPVVLARIVHLEWEKWDLTSAQPAILPESGEPEDYILERRHSQEMAASIDPLWELIMSAWGNATSELVSRRPRKYSITLHAEAGPVPDFFRADGVRYTFVSSKGRAFLEQHASEFVRFEDVATASN